MYQMPYSQMGNLRELFSYTYFIYWMTNGSLLGKRAKDFALNIMLSSVLHNIHISPNVQNSECLREHLIIHCALFNAAYFLYPTLPHWFAPTISINFIFSYKAQGLLSFCQHSSGSRQQNHLQSVGGNLLVLLNSFNDHSVYTAYAADDPHAMRNKLPFSSSSLPVATAAWRDSLMWFMAIYFHQLWDGDVTRPTHTEGTHTHTACSGPLPICPSLGGPPQCPYS